MKTYPRAAVWRTTYSDGRHSWTAWMIRGGCTSGSLLGDYDTWALAMRTAHSAAHAARNLRCLR